MTVHTCKRMEMSFLWVVHVIPNQEWPLVVKVVRSLGNMSIDMTDVLRTPETDPEK